ncbi:hypothetical protein [Paraburkholderia sp. RL17-381-BIF-C]|uniref:hypothetical protein n=1 Tax=Paraburkholderia sp. RL17-381-BIF-C TaxID=3031635 RepID=UPI0038BBE559
MAGFAEYISKSESNDFLRDHDSRFEGLRGTVKNKSEKLKAPLNVITPRLYYIADHSFYCIQLFDYKYYLLAKGMLNGLRENNPLSLANNCRSLLEQVATLSYCMQAVEEMLEKLKDQGSLEKVNQIISKAENALQRTYAGQGKRDPSMPGPEAIHVNSAIKILEGKVGDAISSYDYLCEFVHPNYGNNFLVSAGEIGKGKINSRNNSDETIIRIASIGLSLLEFSNQVNELLYPSLTWRAHHLVELCLRKGAKITNIFSTKKPSPEGDGKTKETAFFFKNARTAQEAMDLSYRYLLEAGYNNLTTSSRVNGGIEREGGELFIYDRWNTKDGEIWFKIPSYAGI